MALFGKREKAYEVWGDKPRWKEARQRLKDAGIKVMETGFYETEAPACGCGAKLDHRDFGPNGKIDRLTYYISVKPEDVERAKELLAQAGYPDGFDMTISVPNNYQPHMDTAEVVAEQLRAVGVNVTIQPMEWGVWHEQVYKGRDFQATLVGLDASAMTARALLERFTSDNAKNFVNYNNPDYDALFTQAMNASDDAQQAEVYKQMETMLSDTAANLYIQDLADLVAMRQNLAGLEFYPIYVLDLSTVHFVK